MKIKFRGVRGSFPVSSATHMRYGGNTSCVEVMTGGGPTIVIDAGTGIREVGKEIVARGDSKQVELLLSHTHWDHIQGLPYFAPLYDAAASVRVHSLKRQAKSLRDILCEQQRPPSFRLRSSRRRPRWSSSSTTTVTPSRSVTPRSPVAN